ncbi:hypothetical protein BH09PAT2_BH09PAT2_05970 [soil metagenome]
MKNTALTPLSFLIGKWNVEMVHTALPNPLKWVDSFEWLEDSFIIWHWEGKNEVPKSTSIIGRNENKLGNIYSMLYYDSRGVSRILEMSFENGIWKFGRLDSDFSQRFDGTVNDDRNIITGNGDASRDGGKTWEHDFAITYRRIE